MSEGSFTICYDGNIPVETPRFGGMMVFTGRENAESAAREWESKYGENVHVVPLSEKPDVTETALRKLLFQSVIHGRDVWPDDESECYSEREFALIHAFLNEAKEQAGVTA